MKIVIIEDEKLTAKDLARTIQAMEPDVEIVAMIESVEEGIEYFQVNRNGCDLIFSDIQLGDGLSFEIFEKVKNQIPVIFCTAFNEYALQAFKTVGIEYLLKPFSKQSVLKALEKFQLLKGGGETTKSTFPEILELLKAQLTTQPQKSGSVLVYQGDKIIPIELDTIALFYIRNDLVFAYTFDQKSMVINNKLDKLEQQYAPIFFRANRQVLLNRKAVKDASQHFNRKMVINLSVAFHEEIIVGKLKVTAFLDWLVAN